TGGLRAARARAPPAPDRRRDRLGRVRARAADGDRAGGQRAPLAHRGRVWAVGRAGVSPDSRRPRIARRLDLRPLPNGRRDRVRGHGRAGLSLRGLMTWTSLVHVVASGLATGSIYALMALSLVIIYNATRTLNFAQGEMLMISTFVGWTTLQVLKAPLVVALLIAVVAAAVLAWGLERLLIRRAISATHFDVLIITLGLSL